MDTYTYMMQNGKSFWGTSYDPGGGNTQKGSNPFIKPVKHYKTKLTVKVDDKEPDRYDKGVNGKDQDTNSS